MSASHSLLLSPAELAYLHYTLSLSPRPIRPDGRSATQFRPLTAETGILPGTNGSARVCFADGTEAVVGVKAEVEKTRASPYADRGPVAKVGGARPAPKAAACAEGSKEEMEDQDEDDVAEGAVGSPDWVELTVEIPGLRDDDSGTVFLSAMLREALLADGALAKKLFINRRFHWKLYVDVVLISPPLAYPLPLLSLTTHLALLATRLPRLRSEADEDPMFDDDWAAATSLYGAPPHRKRHQRRGRAAWARPPITLLVMAVGDNIIFDPTKDELAVADSALAVSVAEGPSLRDLTGDDAVNEGEGAMDVDKDGPTPGRNLKVLAVRAIDPPSRLTAPGVPNEVNAAAWGTPTAGAASKNPDARVSETENVAGVWKAPRGGAKFGMLGAMVAKVLEKGGVADEVLDGLEGVELG